LPRLTRDKAPGDINGFDPQNLWHLARPLD
jgi:predicted lipoprotein with Yx(FWY)xxD motif